jgi:hypothetical protein
MSVLIALAVLVAGERAARAHRIDVPEDYPTIQAAIDAARSGDRIRVGPGTYPESIVWTGKAIALIGAGPDATIVDPSRGPGGRCLTLVDVPHGSRLEGFTCQNGMTSLTSPISTDGAGVLMQRGSLRVERVTFLVNWSIRNGGGMWIEGGDVTVHDASFIANETIGASGGVGGGLSITQGGRLKVVRSLFLGNFANPSGGGLTILDGSTAQVVDSRFEGNFGRSAGGILARASELRVSGSVFLNNGADFAGAAIGASDNVEVADSTFDGNNGDTTNQPVVSVGGNVAIFRSSLTNNMGGGIGASGDITVSDCWFANNVGHHGGALRAGAPRA